MFDAAFGAAAGYAGDLVSSAFRNADNSIARNLDELVDSACSFSADTTVATSNGAVPISELEVGDTVLAYDESTGTTGEYTVTDTVSHDDDAIAYVTIDGEVIETTPWHLFFTSEGWVAAESLEQGDQLVSLDGTSGTVDGVVIEARTQTMYDLTVEDVHTFGVGDGQWVVHNCGGGRVHASHEGGPSLVYEIKRIDTLNDNAEEVWKYGMGTQYTPKQKAGEWTEVLRTYNDGKLPQIRGDEYLNGPVTTIQPDMNLMWQRPEQQVRELNRNVSEGGRYKYDWTLMAITDSAGDAKLLEQFYVSRHVQIYGNYPLGQNETPAIFSEYARYLKR